MKEKQKEKNKHSEKELTILGRIGIFLIGIYLVILALFLIYLFVAFWPTEFAGTSSTQINQTTNIVESGKDISHEVRMILLVIIAGALGSFVHVVTSFVDFVGAKKFKGSWTWWYFLRPFSGSVLALIFYLIIRGGLLSTRIEGTDLSHFGVTGMAGLIGLFSKQAINKLSEMFDIIFMRKEKVELPDSLEKENNQGSDENQTPNKK